MVFIKADANKSIAPANGMFLAISTLLGFSVFSSDALLTGSSSVGTAEASSTLGSCPSAGSHFHGSMVSDTGGMNWYPTALSAGGS